MIGECALCRENGPLCQSHIVPEFLHRPVYDEHHRLMSFSDGSRRASILQKGVRETLLGAGCEARIQRWEHYFARLWYRGRRLPDPLPAEGLVLTGVDYAKLKLFILSIIWRASAARSNTFRSVSLGPHQEKIRSMLLAEQPGHGMTYPIFAGLIRNHETGRLWDEILLMPLRIKVMGLWAYRCVFRRSLMDNARVGAQVHDGG